MLLVWLVPTVGLLAASLQSTMLTTDATSWLSFCHPICSQRCGPERDGQRTHGRNHTRPEAGPSVIPSSRAIGARSTPVFNSLLSVQFSLKDQISFPAPLTAPTQKFCSIPSLYPRQCKSNRIPFSWPLEAQQCPFSHRWRCRKEMLTPISLFFFLNSILC